MAVLITPIIMPSSVDQLPDDVESLKQMLLGKLALIDTLIAENLRLRRWQYGRSAETVDASILQQGLPFNPAPVAEIPKVKAEPIPEEDSTVSLSAPERKSTRRMPRSFPDHLPRETIVHAPAQCDCPECGAAMRKFGEDVSEMLGWVPGYAKVVRHVRPKFSCSRCSKVVQLPAPSRPIERALPTASLLSQIIVAKYADHCPLYRQQGIFRRSGIDLHRATMASWVGEASNLLDPLVEALGRYVKSAEKIHGDDTPVPVLDPGRGQTKTGRLWTYVRDDRPGGSLDPPAVWYRYSPDRQGQHPQAHLKHYQGILQADGYSGYGALYQGGQILEAGCWAHARRKYYEIFKSNGSPMAAEAIARIGQLYAVERAIRGRSPEQRSAARRSFSSAVVDDLHDWLNAQLMTLSAKSELAKAIQYSLTRWTALTRFVGDGRIDLDNNTAERSIRSIVLGRGNYLFMGADSGGERAANIYSLINTCLLNDIDPRDYFEYVLERIGQHPYNRVDALLPWKIKDQIGTAIRQAA